ncbi:MAG: endonuclease/exonuclease/phosphatase family protein [Planctomycetes bacterium]|nr:endonuclease/exonuclease/phosphatase family protein [Planctomycetota bacterium]
MRILSYNIHKGIGGRDRRYRLERVIAVIEEENPDIVCLQEVDRNVRRSSYHDQPALLADYFNAAEKLFQLNVHLKEGGYGNLVLSRWPLKSKHQISLRLNRKKPRGAQMVVIDTPEGLLHVVHWHLGLAERERRWQVNHVFEHHLFREAENLPTLVLGDCNDWRNTLANGPFRQRGFEQVTTPASRFRTFPAWLAVGSLDKAYVRGEIIVRHARIIRTPLSKVASDHLPLVVDFHVGATPLEDAMEELTGSPRNV